MMTTHLRPQEPADHDSITRIPITSTVAVPVAVIVICEKTVNF